MQTNTLTPREWLVLEGDAIADKLVDCGYLTEMEARAWAYHSEMNLTRDVVADELELSEIEFENALSDASDKIHAVKQTARILWTESENWGEFHVEPIDPLTTTFVNSLRSEIKAAGHNPFGQINKAYPDAYRAACTRAARDALATADHPCIVSDVIYLSPDRDSWLDVLASEWLPEDVTYDRVKRAHLAALNEQHDSAPVMLSDCTLRARVVEPTDEDTNEE